MSSRLKTLIFFDTNSLRHTIGNDRGIAYSNFSFSKSYSEIQEFITTSGLQPFIGIAVSNMVFEELKHQKKKSYLKDLENFKQVKKRLEEMPQVTENHLLIPEEEIDADAYIEQKAQEFIQTNNINVVELDGGKSQEILEKFITKVLHLEKPKPPFKTTGNKQQIKDAGFKDNIVWETLLHYDGVKDFDKVILLTEDGGFDGCAPEFTDKWNKHFDIQKNHINLISSLKKDYDNYIEFKSYHDWANTDYFIGYVKDQLDAMSIIQVEGEEYNIENYKIIDYCKEVEKSFEDVDGDGESDEEIMIHTNIEVSCTIDGKKQNVPVAMVTIIEEENTIVESEYDPQIN